MKKLVALLLTVGMVLSLAACGAKTDQTQDTDQTQNAEQTAQTRTITDALGREVELPEKIERIVPLGNTPRMITYLGLADKVVGYGGMDPEALTPLTAYAYVNQEQWKDLPRVGTDAMGNTDYYPEEIIAAQPDVILCTYTEDVVNDLQNATGIPVVAVGQGTLFQEDYDQALRILGEACGVSERAEEVIAFIDGCLADLEQRTGSIPEEDRPTVLSAAATFKGAHGIEGVRLSDPVLTAIHANNVAEEAAVAGADAAEVDKEQILMWNPDYIFCDFGGVELVRQDQAENPDYYEQLSACQNRQMFQHPSSTSYFANLEISLANCYYIGSVLYPEQFADLNVDEKSNEIFKFFLGVDDYLSVLAEYGAGYGVIDFGDSI